MIQRSLIEIEKMVDGFGLTKEYGRIVKGVSIDSRKVSQNQLYIPIKGEKFDGHSFINKAVEAGAAAALWNRSQPLPDIELPLIIVEDTVIALQRLAREYRMQLAAKVIGITGSNGKTSTKDILAGILKIRYRTKKTFGNLNNHLGVPLTLLELDEDTEMAVVEMGISDPGEMEILTSIAIPDVSILTNVGEAHLTTLGTKENIYNEKLGILKGLKEDGLFVYFGDDGRLKEKVEAIRQNQKIQTFGEGSTNTFRPVVEKMEEFGIQFKLDNTEETFFLPMLGKHQMYNAAAAIAVGRYFNISFEFIKEGLLQIDATGMRNELIRGEYITILNDAYKSNPSSLRAALETIYGLKQFQQKIAVLGDMEGIGDEEIFFHKEIGNEIDPNQIDYLFTIGPLAKNIAEMAMHRFPKDKVHWYNCKEDMIKQIKKVLEKDSIILVKASRGFELEAVVDALLSEEKCTNIK